MLQAWLALCQPLPVPAKEEVVPWDAPEYSRAGTQSLAYFDKEVTVKSHQHYI